MSKFEEMLLRWFSTIIYESIGGKEYTKAFTALVERDRKLVEALQTIVKHESVWERTALGEHAERVLKELGEDVE